MASSSSVSSMSVETSSRGAKSVLNYLPCDIKFEGPTEVNSYFQITRDAKDDSMRSHFRGRELRGKVITIPSTVEGLCITCSSISSKQWEVSGHFDRLNLWQHDVLPETAVLEDYMDWFEVSNSVHSK
jgi:hypothetical protein